MAAKFATAGYVLIEDAIAGSDLESLKRELEQIVATAAAEATADGGAWDSAASGLDAGARPDGVDDEGRTACEWAREEGHAEVVRLLERAVPK